MEKRELIRKEILYYIEKNSRANLGELAVLLGTDEVTAVSYTHLTLPTIYSV